LSIIYRSADAAVVQQDKFVATRESINERWIPVLRSSPRNHSTAQAAGPSRYGDKQFERHQPRSSVMTRLPSLANPTISSVASGHEKGQSRKSAVDERHVTDTVNLTVEFGTLRDKRFP